MKFKVDDVVFVPSLNNTGYPTGLGRSGFLKEWGTGQVGTVKATRSDGTCYVAFHNKIGGRHRIHFGEKQYHGWWVFSSDIRHAKLIYRPLEK